MRAIVRVSVFLIVAKRPICMIYIYIVQKMCIHQPNTTTANKLSLSVEHFWANCIQVWVVPHILKLPRSVFVDIYIYINSFLDSDDFDHVWANCGLSTKSQNFGGFFCLNPLFENDDFDHFWVNCGLSTKSQILEVFFGLNPLFENDDFDHFWVNCGLSPKTSNF